MDTNTILILVGIGVAYIIVSWLGKASKDSNKESSSEAPLDLTPYQARKEFFNSSEQMFYSLLQQQLGDRYSILSKVRIEDIITVTDSAKGYRNRIKSSHIDFVLLDKTNYNVKYVIELDGSSHNNEKSQQKDEFKNALFHHVGIPLYRIKVGTDFSEEIQKLGL
jgi:hypothetical protein